MFLPSGISARSISILAKAITSAAGFILDNNPVTTVLVPYAART